MTCMSFLARRSSFLLLSASSSSSSSSSSAPTPASHSLSRCSNFLYTRLPTTLPPLLTAIVAIPMGRRHRRVEVRADSEVDFFLDNNGPAVKDEELLTKMWQAFGRSQEAVPLLVKKVMENTKSLEQELGEELKFGGPRGSLKGRPAVAENQRHRAFYHTLSDSEAKLQFFAARQVACRILGSHGYLCHDCWLPLQDCMCAALPAGSSLWQGVQLWVYMHPKDFLRKNNTGKLLWQALGNGAQLCICGIEQHEDVMWAAFQEAGRDLVWCVYPVSNGFDYEVKSVTIPEDFAASNKEKQNDNQAHKLHFILIDGTWSNSKAMVSRLQDRAGLLWNGREIPCLALSPDALSAMHGLRPQPSIERTCTAAAAAQLLRELHECNPQATHGLDKTADAIDNSIECLSDALVGRRRRVGRPTVRTRRQELRIH